MVKDTWWGGKSAIREVVLVEDDMAGGEDTAGSYVEAAISFVIW